MFNRLFSSISAKKVGTIIGCTGILFSSKTNSYCAKYTQKIDGVQVGNMELNRLTNFAYFIDEGKNVLIFVPRDKILAFLEKNPQFASDKFGYETKNSEWNSNAIYDSNGWYIFVDNKYTSWCKNNQNYDCTRDEFYDIFSQLPKETKTLIFENKRKKIEEKIKSMDPTTLLEKKFINALSQEQKLKLVEKNINWLSIIDDKSFEICNIALKKDKNALKYIPDDEKISMLQFSDKTMTHEQAKEVVNIFRLQNDPNFKLSDIAEADVTDKVKKISDEIIEKKNIARLQTDPTGFGLNKIPQSEITVNVRKVALEINPRNVIHIDATEEEKRNAICKIPDIVLQINNPSDDDKIIAISQKGSSMIPQLKNLNVKVYAAAYNNNIENMKFVPKHMVQKVRDYVASEHMSMHPKCKHCNR